jgi:superfamily II DNA or RNA helicase
MKTNTHGRRCSPSESLELRNYQVDLVREILAYLSSGKINVFVSLPQGTGKTIIALSALCDLVNDNSLESVLVLLPRKALVDQWVDRAKEMYYGISLLKNPPASKMPAYETRRWLKYLQSTGIAMTVQSFKNYTKKQSFKEQDFDLIIVDEAADLVVARDFIEGFRMSAYLTGLEKWRTRKIFLLPYHVSEKKIKEMMRKFGNSALIRRQVEGVDALQYTVKDPITIPDPLVDQIAQVLDEKYRTIRTNVNRILTKEGVEGFRENLETLLSPRTIDSVKKIYGLSEDNVQQIQTLITKYVLVQHLKKWFLYSNREELARSILASQYEVTQWLSHEDYKLNKLVEVVKNYIDQRKKVYIFAQYVATAELITEHLTKRLNLKPRDITIVTGLDEDQFSKLDGFKRYGSILVSTPVFDKGTDIPQADAIIVYTPPLSTEKLFQVVGRIRGGEVTLLAYQGYEETIMEQVAEELRRAFAEATGGKFGIDSYL